MFWRRTRKWVRVPSGREPVSQLHIRTLEVHDLEAINQVITEAAMAWPLPERMKRLALPVLRYDEIDLDHFDAIGAYASDHAGQLTRLLGIAVWDHHALHGLYVVPAAQRIGVGRSLLGSVAERARQAGIARLVVKAERVSASYFERQDLVAAGSESPYPYAYYLSTGILPPGPPVREGGAGETELPLRVTLR